MGNHWLPLSPVEQGPGLDAQGPGLELSTRSTPSSSESEYTVEDEEQGRGSEPLLVVCELNSHVHLTSFLPTNLLF